MTSPAGCPPIEVSRRIAASAERIFAILTDPRCHQEIDGSGMVRGAVTEGPITAAGQTFTIRMQSRKWGEYEMDNHVVEYDANRVFAWEPAAGRAHPNRGKPPLGHRWAYRLEADGPDATLVTEIYDCSRAPEDERIGMDNGNLWVPGMIETLSRLDQLCTGLSPS